MSFIIFSFVLVTFYVIIDNAYEKKRSGYIALKNAQAKIAERETVFKNFISHSEDVLYSLAGNEEFLLYLNGEKSTLDMERLFFTFSKSHNNFMQLRYIDKNGIEKIRIDREAEGSNPFVVMKKDLQDKSGRYYFKDSLSKPLGKVWFSALDLNIEQGMVQKPYNPTLRAVLPVNKNGNFDGIIIINFFMEKFLNSFTDLSLYNVVLFDAEGYVLKHYDKSSDWSFYNNKEINIKNIYPDLYEQILTLGTTHTDSFVSGSLNLSIGNQLFLLLQLKDSYIKEQIYEHFKQYFVVATITFLVSMLISIFIAEKFNTLIKELENKSLELSEANSNLKKFIDNQDNIVILSDGKKINFANKRFFEFFGFKDLEEFQKHYSCISELFIENKRFFYHVEGENDSNWVETVKGLLHSQRIVSMLGKDFKPHAFSISINDFDKNNSIITFANISQTMLEHIKLEDKIVKDKLTGAYNREYFEQNYKRLLQEYKENGECFAVALLDIDHFKSVNDTYGHDVGDAVLVQFVKVIHKYSRKDDILIRWGGEEFIMLLKVRSAEDLEKALEHLRKVIEIEKFPTVGQKTCSMGGTIHKEGEDIMKTVKRADEGVYEAKAAGRNKVVII